MSDDDAPTDRDGTRAGHADGGAAVDGESAPNDGESAPNDGEGVPNDGEGVPNDGEDGPGAGEDVPEDGSDVTDEAELVERISDRDAELGEAVAALRDERDELAGRVEELEAVLGERTAELDERTEQLQRTRADFQNYKDRAERRRKDLEERATEDLVERLLDVRDNLARALDAEGEVRSGVEATLRSFDDVLAGENVDRVEPAPGEDVDPREHEVLGRTESDQPAETVAEVYRPGYLMGEKLLRPAQVAVSRDDGGADGGDGGAADGGDGGAADDAA